MRVQQELVKKDTDMRVVERLISQDQSLSSQVLQIANSAFYHGLVEIKTIRAAIVRLGMQEVGRITLLAATKNQFRSKNKSLNLIMHKLWQHSVGCALGVQWLSKRCKFDEFESHAFFAGLFHDVGKLFVLMVIDQMKEKNANTPITNALLMEAMTVLHTQQGYNLMKQWNLPEEYCVIARDHHNKDFDSKNLLLLLVRLSNMTCLKLGIDLAKDSSLILSATDEAHLLNLSEIDIAELEILLEDTAILAG
jgi:HD-like signal output (HDOD) protein